MSHSIDGATAVVTGGQRGLGKSIVDELLAPEPARSPLSRSLTATGTACD